MKKGQKDKMEPLDMEATECEDFTVKFLGRPESLCSHSVTLLAFPSSNGTFDSTVEILDAQICSTDPSSSTWGPVGNSQAWLTSDLLTQEYEFQRDPHVVPGHIQAPLLICLSSSSYASLLRLLINIRQPLNDNSQDPVHKNMLDQRLGEMALSIQCSTYKHEELSSDHQYPCDMLDTLTSQEPPSLREVVYSLFKGEGNILHQKRFMARTDEDTKRFT
ncbi:hypothetical protein STEG23_019471 [Scotinomys teguina]